MYLLSRASQFLLDGEALTQRRDYRTKIFAFDFRFFSEGPATEGII